MDFCDPYAQLPTLVASYITREQYQTTALKKNTGWLRLYTAFCCLSFI